MAGVLYKLQIKICYVQKSYVYKYVYVWGFPGGASGKDPSAHVGDVRDMGLIPGSGRCPGGGHGNLLQFLSANSTFSFS